MKHWTLDVTTNHTTQQHQITAPDALAALAKHRAANPIHGETLHLYPRGWTAPPVIEPTHPYKSYKKR